jgi:hypothetical protein
LAEAPAENLDADFARDGRDRPVTTRFPSIADKFSGFCFAISDKTEI